jgi:uncharacterized delta-60 repeat protein
VGITTINKEKKDGLMKTYRFLSNERSLPGLALMVASIVSAPAYCVWDNTFNPGGSFNAGASVMAAAVQSDGKVIFGGYFTYNGNYPNGYPFTANNLVRFNPNGTVDTSFNPSPNHVVRAILVEPDQKIIIAGHFTQVAGLTQTYISRLFPGGGPDYIGFQAPVPNNYIYALGRLSDGRIVVGGEFTTMAGFTYMRLACLKSTGGLVATFNPGVTGTGGAPAVWAIAVYPPGTPSADKVLIGGNFTAVAGYSRVNAARLTSFGSIDFSFDMGASVLNGPVYALATDCALFTGLSCEGSSPCCEKIYIGGAFTSPRNYFTRLANAGYPDSNVETAIANGVVNSIRVQSGHGIIVGGAFTEAAYTARNGIARFYPGSVDNGPLNDLMILSAWSDCGGTTGGTVNAVALTATDQVYIGGSFTHVEGSLRQKIARLVFYTD